MFSKYWSDSLKNIAVFILYFAAGKLGLSLAFINPSASPIWAPTGIAIAALLIFGLRITPAIFAGAFLVNLTTQGTPLTSLGIALGNTLEGIVGAYLINRFADGREIFTRLINVFKFILIVILVTLISATFGVTTLLIGGFVSLSNYLPVWLTWWLGDIGGGLVVGPLLILWAVNYKVVVNFNKIIEFIFLITGITLTGLIVFGNLTPFPTINFQLSFIMIPFIIWAAFRFDPKETTLSIFVMSIFAIWGTLTGSGPFIQHDLNASLLFLQSFLAIANLTALSLSVAVLERKRAESKIGERTRQAVEEQARLEASINAINVGFILTDTQANILTINPTAKHILCKSSTDLEPGAFHSSLIFNVKCSMEDIEKTFKQTYDLRSKILSSIEKKNPLEVKELQFNNLILHIFIAPIVVLEGDDLVIIGSVVLVEDITTQKIMERSKDEFFSIASHELRTPLTSIRGNAAMLNDYYADKIEDNTFREMIQDIKESSIRLIEIVNDFLNVSRLEQGKIIFKKEQFDMVSVINEAIREMENLALQKGLYLRLKPPKKTIPKVLADGERAKEVVTNLLSNSIKYTEKGGIEVTLLPNGDLLKVQVSDTGKGIARQQQNLLFRKFQQAGESLLTRDTTKGTGLGLYIAKMLIEGMDGKIYLQASEVGKGSTFAFEIPVAKS